MNIQVINKSKHPLPAYATELSAGMDIRANLSEPITLEPLQRRHSSPNMACCLFLMMYSTTTYRKC